MTLFVCLRRDFYAKIPPEYCEGIDLRHPAGSKKGRMINKCPITKKASIAFSFVFTQQESLLPSELYGKIITFLTFFQV
jgi:hypothetical protein